MDVNILKPPLDKQRGLFRSFTECVKASVNILKMSDGDISLWSAISEEHWQEIFRIEETDYA